MTSPEPQQANLVDPGTDEASGELSLEQLEAATGGYIGASVGVNVNTGTLGRFGH